MPKELLSVKCGQKSVVVAADDGAEVVFDVNSATGKIAALTLRVRDATGTLVFETTPAVDCTKGLPVSLSWNGERNQGIAPKQTHAGRSITQYARPPLASPYTLEVEADVIPTEVKPSTPPPGISTTAEAGTINKTCDQQSKLSEKATQPAIPPPLQRKTTATVDLIQPRLNLISITPVFAPTKDDVDIVCRFENCDGVKSLLLEIVDYQSVPVYQRVFRKSKGDLPSIGGVQTTKSLQWPMAANGQSMAPGDVDDILVVRSPYTTRVWGSLADIEDTDDFRDPEIAMATDPAPDHRVGRDQTVVRCHSLKLELMPWADVYFELTGKDAATVPVHEVRALKILWIKTKLNEMGFFAGPVTDEEGDANFKKALQRYRAMRMVPLDEHVVPQDANVHVGGEAPQAVDQYAGDTFYGSMYRWDGADFVVSTSGVDLTAFASDAAVDQMLVYLSMEKPLDPFDRKADFADPSRNVKLFLRNNRYYVTDDTEWGGVKWDFSATENHCYSIARNWLSEPYLAVRAILTVDDKHGTPQMVPSAMRGVGVAWAWNDLDEILDQLPAYDTPSRINAAKQCASRTKEYLRQAKLRARTHIPGAALYHNAIEEVGGKLVNDDDANSWSAFFEHPLAAFVKRQPAAAPEPGYVVTPAREVRTQSGELQSWTRVYLRTSIIGGDNYKLKLWFDFSEQGPAREPELQALHRAQTGIREVNNAALPGGVYKLTDDRLVPRESARTTVWRQMTLAAFINWPERDPAISWNRGTWTEAEWNLVRNEYRDAYVDIPEFANRNSCQISDRAVFPNIEGDYTAAMAEITERNGWETPDLEIELGGIDLRAVNEQLLKHLGPEKAVATGFPQLIDYCNDCSATVGNGAREAATRAIGDFFRTAAHAVSDPDPDDPRQLLFKPGLNAGMLAARAQGDFTADGAIQSAFKPTLNARLDEMTALRGTFNTALKARFAVAGGVAAPEAGPMWQKAEEWIGNNDPDPQVKDTLREAGQFYKTALEAVTQAGAAAAPRDFKADLKKNTGKAPHFHPITGGMNAYPLPWAEPMKQLEKKLTEPNVALQAHLNPNVDAAALNAFAAKTAEWKNWDLARWQAVHASWTNDEVAVMQQAGTHYEAALGVMAQRANPGAPWTYKPGLSRATLNGQPAYFTEFQVRKYTVDPARLRAALRLRPDGLYPFRLKDRKYDLARAREAMQEAAAQIGYALSRLLHKTVRQRLRLRIEGGKFKDLSDGAVLVDNITHPEMILLDGTPWTPFGLSMGSALGIFFTSHFTPFRLYALGAHEWAHVVIIQHWFNAGGAPKTEHDQSDMNCMMGYPYLIGKGTTLPAMGTPERTALEEFVKKDGAPEKYGKFVAGAEGSFGVLKERMLPLNHLPHFCGKCNLQLRGWNVCAGGPNPVLPRSSTQPGVNADLFPAVGYDPLTYDTGNL